MARAASLGELLVRCRRLYKKFGEEEGGAGEPGAGGGGRGRGGFGVMSPPRAPKYAAASAPAPARRPVTLGGRPHDTRCAPIPRLKALALAPTRPALEGAAALAAAEATLAQLEESFRGGTPPAAPAAEEEQQQHGMSLGL